MAETLISPGVLARENDQSFIQQNPVEFGAAIIGPAVKGPVEIPTLVTSFSEYQAVFGTTVESASREYGYLTAAAANNYFRQGGTSLLVTRVTHGEFTSAFTSGSTAGPNNSGILNTATSESLQIQTISEGAIMNNYQADDSAGGTLDSGSLDNIRWEISGVNTGSGTFSLIVRQGNDTTNQKSILETWNELSLDPFAANYIEKVIGNQSFNIRQDGTDFYVQASGSYVNKSKYISVKQVLLPTPNFFDNNGVPSSGSFDGVLTSYKEFIPVAGSGSFAGASGYNIQAATSPAKFNQDISNTNIQGLTPTDYSQSISLLNNKDEYNFNVIVAPGLMADSTYAAHVTQVNSLVALAENRQDCIAVIDVSKYGSTVAATVNSSTAFDSSYAATYWPWLQSIDPTSGQTVWSPASAFIPGVYSFTDASSEPWFAPAGLIRGALGNVIRAERKLTSGNRDTLYSANVNPIATFPGRGVVVFGQKTLQVKASALDRVNVRRLLITLKSFITQVSDNLVFEQNTIATRNNFLSQVNPYLESVQQRQGLYAFKVVMNETNNTPDVIDRNELVGAIYLQPTKTAEFIILDFNVLPTGVEFPA
jgi:hypothetical protein|tara:strand:- start:125 stop:1906 length:1782 start_codon:yes stop_codon:yes gene_type:complete